MYAVEIVLRIDGKSITDFGVYEIFEKCIEICASERALHQNPEGNSKLGIL